MVVTDCFRVLSLGIASWQTINGLLHRFLESRGHNSQLTEMCNMLSADADPVDIDDSFQGNLEVLA